MVADFYHGDSTPNFKKLRQQGIVGVLHKASDGKSFADSKYSERRKLAEADGMLWGAYHFLENNNIEEQVDFFIKCAGSDVRLALDWEEPPNNEPATVEMALEFLQSIQNKTGQTPWLYGGELLKDQTIPDEFAQFPLWLSEYSSVVRIPKPWKDYTLWQYTENGKIANDLSTFRGTEAELKSAWYATVQGVSSA